jgi:nitronate monooxygenase
MAMAAFLERLRLVTPVVQAGMGGGVARHELAAAVSEAGGLGTIGLLDAASLRDEVAAFRERTDRPLAVNLLLPFARPQHWEAAERADAVVTFWGAPRRRTGRLWIHQCGSVAEALAARGAGADAVIAQGAEAGGHVRGTLPALELLEAARAALPRDFPVLVAGGIADRSEVAQALEAGAVAAVLGTRFVASEESRAHPGYKRRLLAASDTVLTELFGLGWPAPHRVVRNAATERWLRNDPRGPAAVRALNRALSPVLSRLPAGLQAGMGAAQRPGVPLLGPEPPLDDGPESLVDSGPLYAGETVARIADVRPAAAIVRELAV